MEFLFIEGLYYTWKAIGDDCWMAGHLDAAEKAVAYATSDPYRWSEIFNLMKRGYTIDTWDFQSTDDKDRSGTIMRVYLDKSEFNVFFGDNTGMAQACLFLSEMLETAGRSKEAPAYRRLSDELLKKLEEISWNGRFYRHMVEENPKAVRDLGDTDTDAQVTLSNAYSANRPIGHDKAAAIIRTYQSIRKEMPASSPGEWYNCYPPFEKGFGPKWEYMNGGVSTICAGELSRAAFNRGFEEYGGDILERLLKLSDRFGGYLHNTFKGSLDVEAGNRGLHTLGIPGSHNIRNPEELGLSGLPVGPFNSHGIDMTLPELAIKLEGRGEEAVINVYQKAESLYFIHTTTETAHKSGADNLIGWFDVCFEDGTRETQYIQTTRQLEGMLNPAPDEMYGSPLRTGSYRMAWKGDDGNGWDKGVFLYGWDNPHPEKRIDRLIVKSANRGKEWWICGLSASDAPVAFPKSPLSHGIPDMWGAAALVHGLVEGLAGVKDLGPGFEKISLRPRWNAVGETEATACIVYPSSRGYGAYRYARTDASLELTLTGSASSFEVGMILPDDISVGKVTLNGKESPYGIRKIEQSSYLELVINGVGVHEIVIIGRE